MGHFETSIFELSLSFYVIVIFGGIFGYNLYKKFIRKDPRLERMLKNFPKPPEVPIFKNALILAVKDEDMLSEGIKQAKACGGTDRVCYWFGNKPFVGLFDPNDIEKVLGSQDPEFNEKGKEYDILRTWLKNSVLTSNGSRCLYQRRILTPGFHFRNLEEYIQIINRASARLTNTFKSHFLTGEPFEASSYIARCALNVISEVCTGVQYNTSSNGEFESKYFEAMSNVTNLLIKRIVRPWLRPDFIWRWTGYENKFTQDAELILAFIKHVLAQNIEARKSARSKDMRKNSEDCIESRYKKVYKSFLDTLLDSIEKDGADGLLTEEEIIDEINGIIFAGEDTTSVCLAYTLNLLGENKEWQDVVRNEIRSVFQEDPIRDVTNEHLSKLRMTECCLKESLRMYPPVVGILRNLRKDLVLDENTTVPKGTGLFISPLFTHMNPKVYSNPEKFDPSRFYPDESSKRHPYGFIPFSAGARNCLGQKFAMNEMKIVLAHLIRSFEFDAIMKTADIIKTPDLVLRPKYGVKLKISKCF